MPALSRASFRSAARYKLPGRVDARAPPARPHSAARAPPASVPRKHAPVPGRSFQIVALVVEQPQLLPRVPETDDEAASSSGPSHACLWNARAHARACGACTRGSEASPSSAWRGALAVPLGLPR